MIRAEYVFLVGAALQIAVLFPMLLDSESTVPRETSLPTTLIWFVYAVTYFAISFPLAAVANVIGGSLWALVAVYRGRRADQDINYVPNELLPGD